MQCIVRLWPAWANRQEERLPIAVGHSASQVTVEDGRALDVRCIATTRSRVGSIVLSSRYYVFMAHFLVAPTLTASRLLHRLARLLPPPSSH